MNMTTVSRGLMVTSLNTTIITLTKMKNNNTQKEVQMTGDIALGSTLLAINMLIIILNLCTIMVILRFRVNNIIDLFVLALATTDLVKGLIPVPMSVIVYLTDWYLVDGTFLFNYSYINIQCP